MITAAYKLVDCLKKQRAPDCWGRSSIGCLSIWRGYWERLSPRSDSPEAEPEIGIRMHTAYWGNLIREWGKQRKEPSRPVFAGSLALARTYGKLCSINWTTLIPLEAQGLWDPSISPAVPWTALLRVFTLVRGYCELREVSQEGGHWDAMRIQHPQQLRAGCSSLVKGIVVDQLPKSTSRGWPLTVALCLEMTDGIWAFITNVLSSFFKNLSRQFFFLDFYCVPDSQTHKNLSSWDSKKLL